MLNLPQQTLEQVKKILLRQKKDVENQLSKIDKEDPVLAEGLDEASESGTDSWQAEAHTRLTTLKNDLKNLSKKITTSLFRINQGTYGKCDNCGGQIEIERLKAMPTANLCLSCSKKSSKR